jgi:hypothetical protein
MKNQNLLKLSYIYISIELRDALIQEINRSIITREAQPKNTRTNVRLTPYNI